MVDLYSGPPIGSAALTEQGTYAVPSTTGEVLGAAFGEGLAANLTPRIFRSAIRSAAETGAMIPSEGGYDVMAPPEPPMDTDAVNTEFAIPGHLKFDKPTPRSVAQDLYEHKRDQILRQDIIDRREGGMSTGAVARFGANILAGTVDPLNLAVGFIPVLGEARTAALLAGAGSAVGRAGIRAGIGGAQGAVGMAALQPLEFAISKSEREDYTMADALRSIAVGTVFGGGMHATIGGVVDRVTGKYRNPVSQALEESGPEARQALLHRTLAQTIDGRPVSLEADLPLVDAMRAREVARMTVRQGGRDIDQALPGAFEDPLVLARRGELTAERAAQIRDDLAGLSAADVARAKAQIGEHVDPEMWKVIADNLAKAEGSREGAIAVVADQLRYLPASGAIRTASEREAAAVIGRAMQAEAARGGDVGSLIDSALRQRHGEAGAPSGAAAGGIPFVMTRAMRAGLRDLGHTSAAIRNMTPVQAHEILTAAGRGAGAARPEVAALKQQLLDMHAQGTEALAARTPLVGGSIASDAAAAFVAAGRTEAEAAAYGRWWQAVAERRAQAFRGLRGTAEDLYRDATDDQRALLTLFRDADATGIGHKSWHIFTNELFDDALHPDAPPELIADAAALKRAVGAEDGVPLTREQQEQLAGWGEQYLREGRAPVPELQGIFDRFRAWFLNVYETIAGLGAPLNDEVRGIYDRMISLDGRPPESGGGVRTPAGEGRPFERARAAGEPGGPRSSDTIAQINAQSDELERLRRPGGARPEAQAETLAASEAAAEADARASAHEQAAYCIMRG